MIYSKTKDQGWDQNLFTSENFPWCCHSVEILLLQNKRTSRLSKQNTWYNCFLQPQKVQANFEMFRQVDCQTSSTKCYSNLQNLLLCQNHWLEESCYRSTKFWFHSDQPKWYLLSSTKMRFITPGPHISNLKILKSSFIFFFSVWTPISAFLQFVGKNCLRAKSLIRAKLLDDRKMELHLHFPIFWKKNSGETWCNSGVIRCKSGETSRTTVFWDFILEISCGWIWPKRLQA